VSIEALNWARQCEVGSSTRKFVLFALADRWNADTGVCWPSVRWICEFTELGERTVRRALDELETDGFIIHDGWFGRADRQTKVFRLPVDNPIRTGCQNGTPNLHGVPESPLRGARESTAGCQSGTLTIREPLENRAQQARRKRRPVDNLTRAAIPSPEETLRMLEEERT
jgi:hypothetical protein